MNFEWDARRNASNLRKHRVGFEEAASVFLGPLARIFDDPCHSSTERREIIVGHSVRDQLLLVCFTEETDTVRLISARRATRRERNDYEENSKD